MPPQTKIMTLSLVYMMHCSNCILCLYYSTCAGEDKSLWAYQVHYYFTNLMG